MGARVTRTISEQVKFIREGRRWQVVGQAKRGQTGSPQGGQGESPQRDKAPPEMRGPLKPVRGKGQTTALGGRTGLKAMGVTVRSPTVATEPSIRKMTGMLTRVEGADDNFADEGEGLGVKMLGGLLEGPRAQHAIHGVLEALVYTPADFTKPEVRDDETNLGFRAEKEGPTPNIGQEEFAMVVHGQSDAAHDVTQGRERTLGSDIPKGKPTVPKVLETLIFVVAIEAIDCTLKEEESRVRSKREDQGKGGPAVLTLETEAKGLRRLSTISVKDLVVGGVGFSRVKSPRPQGAGQRQSFLLWGGEARTECSPGLGKDIPSANALFGGPASVGNVAA